jgi:tripartite-type tricarboxylate transporter receptor subunit TctC
MGGQIVLYCSSMPPAVPQLKAGRLKALGVTAAKRLANMPDVPAVAETVPGYEAVNWYGVFLPAGAPREIVNKLHADVAKVINLPDVKERFAAEGGEPVGNTPEQFAAIIRAEIPRWAKVIKDAGIKVD